VKFSIQLLCWSSSFDVLSIEHNQIAWLIYWCRFGFHIMVLPLSLTGILKSLLTELIKTCHPLNIVMRRRISRGFYSWPACSKVIAIVRKEWCHFNCGMERVVIGKLCHWQHFFQIILFVIAVISKIAFQCLVCFFCLSIGLGMKG